MDSLTNILRNLGPTRLITLVLVGALLVGFMVAISSRISNQDMALLYGGLDAAEASKIVTSLASSNETYEVRGDSRIYVPRSRVGELRLKMAGAGLIGSSTKGYEIFDNSSSFGTTSLVQNINARRALEGELARTISSLPAVTAARVHIVLPKHQLFSQNSVEPTAAVTVNLGSRLLNDGQVNSITHLIAAAVPDLKASKVVVVDNRGNLLSSGQGNEGSAGAMSASTQYQHQIEGEFENRLTRMLERVVGSGKVSVKVTADVNFDHVEENAEIFNPDQQVARSEQRSEDINKSNNTEPTPPVGLSSNVPGQEQSGSTATKSTDNNHSEETINYEISRTVRKHVREGGTVNRLSVAVLVEGTYTKVDGEEQYVPLSTVQQQKLETLVKTAIGFDDKRGDKVELIDMPFQAIQDTAFYKEPFLSKSDIMKLAEYGLMFVGLLMMIFFVIRPILKAASVSSQQVQQQAAGANQQNSQNQSSEAQAEGGRGQEPSAIETMIDLDKVEGRVRESTVRKVTEIIEARPEQSVNVIRGWLAPESAES